MRNLILLLLWTSATATAAPAYELTWKFDGSSYRYSKSDEEFFLGGEETQISFPISNCLRPAADQFHERLNALVVRHRSPKKRLPAGLSIEVQVGSEKPMQTSRTESLGRFLVGMKIEIEKLRYVQNTSCAAKPAN